MEEKEETKYFDTATELALYLNTGRPTLYRRAKKLGISANKGYYTLKELELLGSPLDGIVRAKPKSKMVNKPKPNNKPEQESANQKEVEYLKEELKRYQEQLALKDEQLALRDEQLKLVPSSEYIELLKYTTRTAEDTIKNTNEQLRAKDTQLEALTKALDQSQRLQSDLQIKLDKARLQLEMVQNTDTDTQQTVQNDVSQDTHEQLNRTQEHKGFWARLFNN